VREISPDQRVLSYTLSIFGHDLRLSPREFQVSRHVLGTASLPNDSTRLTSRRSRMAGIPFSPPAPDAKPAQTYVVQPGDTLEKISRKFYGRPDRWSLLYMANTNLLNERPLSPGMELIIPNE
jgi:hypothetical protein